MATKRAKKGTKKIKDLPAKRLTTRRAKSIRGGATTANPTPINWSGSGENPTESISFVKK